MLPETTFFSLYTLRYEKNMHDRITPICKQSHKRTYV